MEKFRARAKLLRSRQTSAEAKLWQALRNRSLERWKFRRQHPIDRYVVDFVTLGGKLVIEVDGATHGSVRELAHDRERTAVLEACGFHVLRITNTDVYEDIASVLELIRTTLPEA